MRSKGKIKLGTKQTMEETQTKSNQGEEVARSKVTRGPFTLLEGQLTKAKAKITKELLYLRGILRQSPLTLS